MAVNSSIEWTESTWNPITGCTKISSGCKNCYAERMAVRLKAMGQKNYRNGFNVELHKASLELPLGWKKPQTIFVNSMSDLFHEKVPFYFIKEVFKIMEKAYWHRFQILTKRADRLQELNYSLKWLPNIWMGVTIEAQTYIDRCESLKKTGAYLKFLSLEPLLGRIDSINLRDIDWVIVGGESGPDARPMKKEWVACILQKCLKQKVPFFFKQWGGVRKKKAGRLLDGRTWDQMPAIKDKISFIKVA